MIAIEIGAIEMGEIAIAIIGAIVIAILIGTIAISKIAIDADRCGAGDHADRSLSLSLSLSVFCSRGFLLSVALSLFYAYYEKCLKVKRFCKMISGLTSANFG